MGMNRQSRGVCLLGLGLGLGLFASLAIPWSPASSSPISVQHIGAGQIGRFLTHHLNEEIGANPELHLSDDADEGWKVVLLTSEGEGSTFYSAVLVRKQFDQVFDQYVFAFQGVCAVARLQNCAREIVAKLKEPIAQFETDWRDLSEPDAEAVGQSQAVTAN